MSSSEESNTNVPTVAKRPRACDACRRKKIRCDGTDSLGTQCYNCIVSGLSCTYVEESTRRALTKKYVASLEDKIEELVDALRALCPDEKIFDTWVASLTDERPSQVPLNPSDLIQSRKPVENLAPMELPPANIFGPKPLESLTKALRASSGGVRLRSEREDTLAPPVPASSLDTSRFFGKSSGEMFARTALSIKEQYVGHGERPILSHRREEFWTLRPWERISQPFTPRRYEFPEPALGKDLVDLYFKHHNIYLALLHRPSFERSIREGLHFVHDGFASVYLLVCAIGSRFSTDPRVLLDGVDSYHSAGWKWYDQVETGKTTFLSLPSLYDLQLYCLTVIFLHSSSAPQAVWTMVGIALRLAQDVGAHRRRSTVPSMEDELWKRAWWVLICVDRTVCLFLGRPLTVHDEDFDLDLPIDCDDEYWEHPDPSQRFKQPPNKPSSITSFILLVKLSQILSVCVRAIYSLNKLNAHLGLGDQWKSQVVRELDLSVNDWMGSIPEHLRWDPQHENDKFFSQSSVLYAMGYYAQILIHRPFIFSQNKPSVSPVPSLAICTNAARSCINIAYTQLQRDMPLQPPVQIAMFTSSVMLMFGIWDAKTLNPNSEKRVDMENVQKALRVLKAAEDRWQQAGRFWDILSVLSSRDPRPFSSRSESSAAMSSESLETRESPLPHIQTYWSQVPGKNSERSQPIAASVGEDSSLDPFHLQDYWDLVSDGYHLDNLYLPYEPEGEIDFHPPSATYSTTQPLPEMTAASWMPQQPEPVSLSPTLNPSPSNNGYYATQNDTFEFMQLQSHISAVIAAGNQHCVESRGVAQRGWVKKVYSDGDSLWSNISPEYGVDNVLDNNPEVA